MIPNNIHRLSDDVKLELVGLKPKTTNIYTYRYINGILKGTLVDYTEDEIKKQMNNYWV